MTAFSVPVPERFDANEYFRAVMSAREIVLSPEDIIDRTESLLSWLALGTDSLNEDRACRDFKAMCLGLVGGRLLPSILKDGVIHELTSKCIVAQNPPLPDRIFGEDFEGNTEADAAYDLACEYFGADGEDMSWAHAELSDRSIGRRLSIGYIGENDRGGVNVSFVARIPEQIVDDAKVRRLGRFVGPIYWISWSNISNHGMFKLGGRYLASSPRPGLYLDHRGRPSDYLRDWITQAYADQFKRRYRWHIEISLNSIRTGVALETDAIGARAFLRLRDVRKGNRRAALIHWVRAHHRRNRWSADSSQIRTHFRGRTECSLGGLWCRVWPSAFDIDRAANGSRIERRLGFGG